MFFTSYFSSGDRPIDEQTNTNAKNMVNISETLRVNIFFIMILRDIFNSIQEIISHYVIKVP